MPMNRRANSTNPFQGDVKRVLTVCSAGLLRSPTAAVVLSQEPFNYNTRAVGMSEEYALIPIDADLVFWADEIVFMHPSIEREYVERFGVPKDVNVVVLNIPDTYGYRDPRLVEMIREQYTQEIK